MVPHSLSLYLSLCPKALFFTQDKSSQSVSLISCVCWLGLDWIFVILGVKQPQSKKIKGLRVKQREKKQRYSVPAFHLHSSSSPSPSPILVFPCSVLTSPKNKTQQPCLQQQQQQLLEPLCLQPHLSAPSRGKQKPRNLSDLFSSLPFKRFIDPFPAFPVLFGAGEDGAVSSHPDAQLCKLPHCP